VSFGRSHTGRHGKKHNLKVFCSLRERRTGGKREEKRPYHHKRCNGYQKLRLEIVLLGKKEGGTAEKKSKTNSWGWEPGSKGKISVRFSNGNRKPKKKCNWKNCPEKWGKKKRVTPCLSGCPKGNSHRLKKKAFPSACRDFQGAIQEGRPIRAPCN